MGIHMQYVFSCLPHHIGRARRWALCIAVDTAKYLAFSQACPGRRTVEAKKTQTPSILGETMAVCLKETHVWTLPSSDARVKDGRYSAILQLHENRTPDVRRIG